MMLFIIELCNIRRMILGINYATIQNLLADTVANRLYQPNENNIIIKIVKQKIRTTLTLGSRIPKNLFFF